MQTILGSGGTIGTDLAKYLKTYTNEIRLVSRTPKKVNDSDILYPADLSSADQIDKAIEGSEVCYLTIGFDYKLKVWKEKWPPLIKNVVDACIRHHSKLVFFDNVYAIGAKHVGHIIESSPINPTSKKGAIRAAVDRHILENVEKGKLQAIIARSPDFFGPVKTSNSLLMSTVYDNLKKGKSAQWLCNSNVIHTMGYGPELAKGTAMLGNTSVAYNQVWNLPVDQETLTGKQWVKLFAEEMNCPDKLMVLPGAGIWFLGLFIPVLMEFYEMRYQFDRDYFFDSSKFIKHFHHTPISNREAVKQVIAALNK
ncbi:MAG: NAD-dependent epimerase/dehydratase family protein [Bacteroidetes bacterium]|nr:NAD-dependent epimerase/dehydratase family protein [Bacteroidota bacterium]